MRLAGAGLPGSGRPLIRDGGGWGSRPGLRQAAPPPAQPR